MNLSLPVAELTALLLASVRAAAWLMISPPFNTNVIPAQIKALLSVAIALPVVPSIVGKVPALDTAAMVVSLAEQVVLGTALGFLTALLFAAVQAAGSLIDLFGGFSLAFAFDPMGATGNGGSGVFGRFYNLVAITLLFATDGHQLVLRGFTTSYNVLPLNGTLSLSNLQHLLTDGIVEMFAASLQIAGPLIAVLFCADIGLGLLSRVAPALNAFSLGFPVKILLTLTGVGLAMTMLPLAVENLVDKAVKAVMQAIGS
ncbi:flagellar biosynthetic protein FliR [Planosporangium flavigriseum]|uniref:Flagellar biosynthetic protein FliR n=1 Tax=Planosporangium flavigriseum TaxID=373681 RepID=A0A8J3LKB7_9ACTN|nr:flagellar biosynthetic protein FliR [Planosporangium flavigriseum]NJC66377.1 flagellar biosynthetic protein FliR [Planosporangium flavigriseum]GIG74217.1 flagellar biosynthetic protein FliR [Planosporangium flavigriseum]